MGGCGSTTCKMLFLLNKSCVRADMVSTGTQGCRLPFYLTMHSTHFICGYMASDIW